MLGHPKASPIAPKIGYPIATPKAMPKQKNTCEKVRRICISSGVILLYFKFTYL